jgi:hypothetical protein
VRPQFDDLRNLQRSADRRGNFIGFGRRDPGVRRRDLVDELSGPLRQDREILRQFARQDLFHELVQHESAHASRTDRHFQFHRVIGLRRRDIRRLQAVGIVIARPPPRHGRSSDGDGVAFRLEYRTGLLVGRIDAGTNRPSVQIRPIQLGKSSVRKIDYSGP